MNKYLIVLLIFIIGAVFGLCSAVYSIYAINKCPDCEEKQKITVFSLKNIGISVINIVLWELIYIINGISTITVIYMLCSTVLLALSVVDLAVYEIPIECNIVILIAGILLLIIDYTHWYNYLIGSVLVSGIFLIIALATKGNGMGGGDIKLMFTCGLLLGWQKIFFVMLLGSLLGSVIHITRMKISKKEHMLAFGPYLSAAVVIMMIAGNQFLQWYIDTFLSFNY